MKDRTAHLDINQAGAREAVIANASWDGDGNSGSTAGTAGAAEFRPSQQDPERYTLDIFDAKQATGSE